MDFSGKKVLVVGMARSGLAAMRALQRRGAVLSACDRKDEQDIRAAVEEARSLGASVYTGSYPEIKAGSYDLIVSSPGVPLDIEPIWQAYRESIPVIGELELAYLIKPPGVEFLAVSGTNGKTTTVSLLQVILSASGINSMAGGNIGIPLSSVIEEMSAGVVSVEVSSFQLETVMEFHPHICGLLNITPDHIDRHRNLDNYIEAKARIFRRQSGEDYALLNYEDRFIRAMAGRCPARVVFFSNERILDEGVFIRDGIITISEGGTDHSICSLQDILLRGKHNLENILCAVGMAWYAGANAQAIAKTLKTFTGVRHRMEEVAVKNGVLYVNDSKATNPESAMKALESFSEPVVLIAGGRNKGSKFDSLAEMIKDKARAVVILGESRRALKESLENTGFNHIFEAADLQEAVDLAGQKALPGDVVLLSPACASWDMFDNFEQRGDLFCQMVRRKSS